MLQVLQVLQTVQNYDYLLSDTRDAHRVLVENAVLAADIYLSPRSPKTLAEQEFLRGTIPLDCHCFQVWRVKTPVKQANCMVRH